MSEVTTAHITALVRVIGRLQFQPRMLQRWLTDEVALYDGAALLHRRPALYANTQHMRSIALAVDRNWRTSNWTWSIDRRATMLCTKTSRRSSEQRAAHALSSVSRPQTQLRVVRFLRRQRTTAGWAPSHRVKPLAR